VPAKVLATRHQRSEEVMPGMLQASDR